MIKDAIRNHDLESDVYPSINRATLIKDAIRNHELESNVYPSINRATLIKDAIRNYELESNVYPSMDDIAKGINLIPDLLKTFVNELIKSPVKQMSISQAIVAAAKPRAIMPLLFGLALATDNLIGSKWLNNILSKMRFAVSYDEVNQLHYQLFKSMSFSEIKFHLIISAICTFESASHSFNA